MKLITKVSTKHQGKLVAPGGEIEIKDKAEAQSLIERGFAVLPAAKAEVSAEGKSEGGEAK